MASGELRVPMSDLSWDMDRWKLMDKNTAAILLAFIFVLALSGCGQGGASGVLDKAEAGQIYAAAVSEIYHVDHSFGEAPGWPLVYVVTKTDDEGMFDGPKAPAQNLPAEVQYAVETELAQEPFQLIWAESMDEVPVDPSNGQIAEGQGIAITFGNIHPQEDGTVQLSFFMTCGGLCGIGKTYVLSEIDGKWQVTGSVGPEIMS